MVLPFELLLRAGTGRRDRPRFRRKRRKKRGESGHEAREGIGRVLIKRAKRYSAYFYIYIYLLAGSTKSYLTSAHTFAIFITPTDSLQVS